MSLHVDPEVARKLRFRVMRPKHPSQRFIDMVNHDLLQAVRLAAREHGTSMSGYIRAVMYLVVQRHYDRRLPLKELFDASHY